MKTKTVFITCAVFLFALCGCASAPHKIGYDLPKSDLVPVKIARLHISPFTDQRPEQEKTGVRGKLLKFSSRDAHFSQPVSEAIEETLSRELQNAGFSIIGQDSSYDYKISGAVKHFQAVMSPAKITFLPYLGSVSTIWAKDDFNIALSIQIEMVDRSGKELINRVFDVSEQMRLSTGLLNLARYSRGFNYKLKLLDEALKDVLGQIRDEVSAKVK